MKERIPKITHSQYAIRVLDWIFKYPIFMSNHCVGHADIPEATARRLLKMLATEEIIKPVSKGAGRRPTLYRFPELLNIAEGADVF